MRTITNYAIMIIPSIGDDLLSRGHETVAYNMTRIVMTQGNSQEVISCWSECTPVM